MARKPASTTSPKSPPHSSEIPDFLLGAPNRVLSVNGKFQILPAALAFAQAEYVLSMRVSQGVGVKGSEQVPCIDCFSPCWRAPSSPKRVPIICPECCQKRINKGE